ncbi:TVP38/TMEM64 family protein [Marinicrinis lubricantis]|uniref:TVP38/TMEM64 family membrane protein n=1 Tax=Marinicrinis lubricantis TaxID=2086470 RepID=A0ABW1IS58_9BACL
MSLVDQLKQIDMQDVEQLLDQYEALGPLPGIGAALLESFFPVLPLIAIIVANVNAYGAIEGFLLSWAGVVIGAMCVFYISRKFGKRFRSMLERKFTKSQGLFRWIEQKGFTPIFLLSCFPFTPSSLINIFSGMSNISTKAFFIAILLGKGIMILMVTFVGYDIAALIRKPLKLIIGLIVLFILWLIGRKMESRIQN